MWSHERQAKILELLGREGKVLTNHLADLFDISRETVRRDLLEMESMGSLTRVHGGAIPRAPKSSPSRPLPSGWAITPAPRMPSAPAPAI